MNRRRAIDIFSMFTDPGVPVLFLLGTIVLAVLGNAIYDLLLALLDPARDPAIILRLSGVSGGALVALLAVVLVIWLWFRLQRRRLPPEVAPAQLLDAGYAGLILFVSERADAAERTAISHHLGKQTLRQLWLIVTQESRDKTLDLIRWLRAQPGGDQVQVTQLPLADAYDLASAYDALVGALALAGQDLDQVIVDITGGTKYMSPILLLLNYSHPLPADQLARLATICGATPEVRALGAQIDRARPIAEVAQELADAAGLPADDWQTTPLLLNPPALAPLALALIAEIHGRSGGFPALLNVRPVADSTPTRYEVAEVVNLQALRDAARKLR